MLILYILVKPVAVLIFRYFKNYLTTNMIKVTLAILPTTTQWNKDFGQDTTG